MATTRAARLARAVAPTTMIRRATDGASAAAMAVAVTA